VLGALGAVGVVVVGGGSSSGGGGGTAVPATGQVRVSTDVAGGELFVDDVSHGPVVNAQLFTIPPGAHRLEVRVGTTVMTRQELTVTAGAFHEAALSMPVSTFEGALATGDPTLQSGEFVDEYLFNWPSGAPVRAEVTSTQFDTYVLIKFPDNSRQENDDIESGNTNSRLEITTTASGTYRVWVTSYQANETGAYVLTVRGPAELRLN
jgi:hypothetical protein